ncbi:MAG: VPGUxxT family thioredoxin-like (seleno)protein, type 2 [Saprospiraceae bacterium]|nr:VPGUxxT family thioredoxin-like (seleno)protein, type 2 [Saprospiraceae bacterium]
MNLTLLILLFPVLIAAQTNPVELGDVHWLRSMDEAQAKSKKEGKPILILFQEIPGCETCRNYGSDVLTHPLIVEGIETEFIPLAIHNNKGGHDAEVLRRFNEASWNNPVVHIVDMNIENIVQRLSDNYSVAGLSALMTNALIKQKGKAPVYLQLLTDELTAQQKGTASVTYSMYCFWTGEALFGKLNGVIKTTAGYQSGREVVTVEFNPAIVSKTELDKIADSHKCSIPPNGSFTADTTPKYYLSSSPYKVVPMTEIQKCRVNSAIGEGQDPKVFLSDRQIAFLKSSSRNCVAISLKDCW